MANLSIEWVVEAAAGKGRGGQTGAGIGHLKCKLRANYGQLAAKQTGEQVF